MMNTETKYRCSFCDKHFKQRQTMYRHVRKFHNMEPLDIGRKNITCPVKSCKSSFFHREKLRNHIIDVHNVILEVEKKTFPTFEVSSLPQGWHGVIGPCKASTSSSAGISGSSVPVTIRKKWNSPLSSNVPQTKLPSYKSSNLRQQNHKLNSTYQIKPSVAVCPPPQTKLPTPSKPSPVKEYKDEIAKLKKELSTMKAENSILKAKVRRVDDENLQKGRQIEKMRSEIKVLQKNDSANSRRSRESQELLSLRQKCLRLENALKDKDLVIKRLTNESLMKKEAEIRKTSTICTPKQIYQVSCAQRKQEIKNNEKESISAKSNLSRASHTLKNEVTKLRDMIHKLEKENQDLQQQAKHHCQEIRRLKVQLKSKVSHPQTSILKSVSSENSKNLENKPETVKSTNQRNGNLQTKVTAHSSFVPKQKLVKNNKIFSQNVITSIPAKSTQKQIFQKPGFSKSISKNGKTSSLSSGSSKKPSSNKQIRVVQSKLPVTKSSIVRTPSHTETSKANNYKFVDISSDEKLNLEYKIQEMRENIAAKKIQRSWREHQKHMQHSSSFEFQSEGKALTFIISSIKHHKLRKSKLNFLVKKKNHFPDSMRKETFLEAIESISKKVWDQDFNTS